MNDGSDPRQPRENGADPEISLFQTVLAWFGRLRPPANGDGSMREKLEELIEEQGDAETPIGVEERVLLSNVLGLNDRTVADVMVPRADIIAIEAGAPVEALVEFIAREGHSRIPVFSKTLDEAMGMVHIKDVLITRDGGARFDLRKIIRQVLFVAPSMRVLELLLEMRVKRCHMALVVDEFGGVDGLVTIEDLVEEIVGEIEDEHDRSDEANLTQHPDGAIDANARASLESLEQLVGPFVSEEEREEIGTLGGLLFLLAGRVPIRGELISHPSGLEFEVLEADPRRIKRIRVRGHDLAPPP